jgi:hypothetical protein
VGILPADLGIRQHPAQIIGDVTILSPESSLTILDG